MKKFLMAIFALAVAASVATAGVGINWMDDYRVFASTETDMIGGSVGILDVASSLWQLIYAGADNTPNPVDWMDGAGGAGIADDYVTGDDVVWAERTLSQILTPGGTTFAPEDGTEWTGFLEYCSGNTAYIDYSWSTAGFVYQRIFEGPVALGSLYYQSELLALNLGYTSDAGTSTPIQDFGVGDATGGGVHADTAVPEPATMGLLGLGALVMAIRRRRA